MANKFTSENFETEVLQSDIPVLVDFYADWCGPCKMMGPVVERIAEEFEGRLKVGKLNVDDEGLLAQKYRVMSIPTLIFFKNGEAVESSIGALNAQELTQKCEQILA